MEPDEMKSDFNFIIRLSHSVNREIGLCLIDNGEAAMSFGNENSANVACPVGEPKLIFHTHPLGTTRISIGDINGLLNARENIKDAEYCIGAMKDGEPEISCLHIDVVKEHNRVQLSMVKK